MLSPVDTEGHIQDRTSIHLDNSHLILEIIFMALRACTFIFLVTFLSQC